MKPSFDREEFTDHVLHFILSNPTAPYRESAVLAAIDTFAKDRRKNIQLQIDRAGNRIFSVRGRRGGARKPTIAFTAHLDHPGLVPGPDGKWELLGRVWPSARLANEKICYFKKNGEPAGRGTIIKVNETGGRVLTALSRGEGAPSPGEFAMFDFPPLEYDGDRIVGRVCDDLLGAISILVAIEEAIHTNHSCSFMAAFTRAEETGFVGALAMLKNRSIPAKLPIVGLECSAARGGNAVIGDGPIVRVGDRIATFDPEVTAFLRDCAESIKKDDPKFQYQRRLMQGGACESTAYQLDGRRAGALCLALGNYHNVPDPDPEDITTGLAPEFVSKSDLDGLIRVIVRAVADSARLADPWRSTRRGLADRLRDHGPRLREIQ
ncbi:MAG: hypothetical protein HY286_10310 [Planctomycetes bacterium]|nr:hypothetical protein [Planctomycetota bacterium]